MSFYSGSDNDFNKKLVQFEPKNIIKKCKSNNFSLSNEIRETTRALEAMDYVLQNPIGSVHHQFQQQPNVYNTMNIQNIQNNHHHHHYYNNSSNNSNSKKTSKTHYRKPKSYNSKTSKKHNEGKHHNNTEINQSNINQSNINQFNNNVKVKTKAKEIKNSNVKKLYNTSYLNNLKIMLNKVLSYQLVTDFYNYNKKDNCSKCKVVTFHPVNICNSCQNKLCFNCFYQLFSGLKTTEGKNNYHNSKTSDCSSFKVFLKTLSQEITCYKCKTESIFSKLCKKIDDVIRNNELDSKSFYKWKKISDMKYFEKDNWSLIKSKHHTDCQNINKDKINNYSFSIAYHPKKDVFTISLNPHLLKLYNISNSNTNSIRKIELYYPYQNYLFVDTAYQGLEKIMLQCKSNCLHNNNINELINKWNSYCYQFNSILVRYKEQKRNYSCNEDLNTIAI